MGIKNILCIQAAALLAIVLASGCATYSTPEYQIFVSRDSPPSGVPPPNGGYTWQQLVNLAVAANTDYASILAKARAEYYRYKARTELNDPRLSLEYSFLSEEKKHDQYGMGISFSIPNPFVNKQVIRTGEAARRETETSAEVLKNEITSMIYELIQEILIGERKLQVLLLREQVLSDWADFLQMRYDAHLTTQADIREFDIQRLRLKAAVRQARFTAQAARRSLEVLIQIPDEQLVLNPFPSDWEAVLAALEDEEALIKDAYSRSPELAGAYAAYEKACATLDAARAKQIPWFNSVFLSYSPSITESTNYNDNGELISPQRISNKWTLGLNLYLPVFVWFSSEKKMAATEIEAASLKISGIRGQIRNDITGIIADLRDTLYFLIDYQSTLDSIPEPTRETIPNVESYYKLLDSRLSSSEYALQIELRCAHIYSQLLRVAGGLE